MSELLRGKEIFQKDALVHLMVESDFIESLFEVPAQKLIIDERLLRQKMQVLLERLSDEVRAERLEQAILGGLTLEKGEHAPRDTHDWEMFVVFTVVLGSPLHDTLNLVHVLLIFIALFGITWDIDSRDAGELPIESGLVHAIVNRHDSGSRSLQKVSM